MLNALIFDVDGTMADTESTHRNAFNAAFFESGLDWHWSETLYMRLLDVAGGKERIQYYWNTIDPNGARSSSAKKMVEALHAIKTRHYEDMVGRGKLSLRPGIRRLLDEARLAGVPVAIATTTSPENVDVLLKATLGPDWRGYFAVVCDASAAEKKKPAPDVYLAALNALTLPATECLAFEDSENGLRAAMEIGIPTIITPTAYTVLHQFDGALLILPHLGDPEFPMSQHIPGADHRWADLAALRRWHEGTLFEAA
jgi:HAD superfamily hydrolase (TIGR01509 family)